MSFRILVSDDPDWMGYIQNLPADIQDLHYLPGYGKIYEAVYGFKPQLAVWDDGKDFIVQPFVIRPLNTLPFLEGQSAKFFDIANAYGYGGPLGTSSAPYKKFYDAFHAHCVSEGYASEFCSLHPLLSAAQNDMVGGIHKLNHLKDVFSVALMGDILAGFSQGHRRNYRKAIANGVRVEKMPINPQTMAQFQEIYIYTMERHGAAERWFFPDDYFPSCHTHLGDAGASLFFAYVDDKLASACFLIHGFKNCYYHFGGSYEEFHETRASNLLMTEAMLWAQGAGYTQFHLGGGVSSSPDDPLTRFKSGFGARAYPLYSYEKIHAQGVYDELSALKVAHERKKGENIGNSGYFPLYRR